MSAQAEPEAWVMFFLPTCVSISFFKTSLIMFPDMVVQRQRWKPAGDFCSKLPLNWDHPCDLAPGWGATSWLDTEDPHLLTQRPSESQSPAPPQSWHFPDDFPGHCWFVGRLLLCKCCLSCCRQPFPPAGPASPPVMTHQQLLWWCLLILMSLDLDVSPHLRSTLCSTSNLIGQKDKSG